MMNIGKQLGSIGMQDVECIIEKVTVLLFIVGLGKTLKNFREMQILSMYEEKGKQIVLFSLDIYTN